MDPKEEQSFPSSDHTPDVVSEAPKIPNPVQPEKKSKFIITILGFSTIFASLLAGFFIYQTQKLTKEISSMKSSQNQAAPAPTSALSVTSQWENYSTKTFTFKYPDSLNVEKNDNGDTIFSNGKGDPESIWFKLITIPTEQSLTAIQYAQTQFCSDRVNPNYDGSDLKDIIDSCEKNITTIPLNRPSLDAIITHYNFYENPITAIIIAGNKEIILIESTGKTGNEASILSLITLDQLLSTFKFTN